MPAAVVTVRWLQPPRYRGMEETVSRSRVRQRGPLNVGEEVRVRYKRSYYKAEIIDVPSTETTVQTDHQLSSQVDDQVPAIEASLLASPASPLRLQDTQEASSPDSPPRLIASVRPPSSLPYFTPFASTPLVPAPLPRHSVSVNVNESASETLAFNPVPEFQLPRDSLLGSDDTDGVTLFPEESASGLAPVSFVYSVIDSAPEALLDDDDVDSYHSDADSYDSDDSDDMPTYVSSQESDAAIQEQAQQMIANRSRSRLSTTNPIPASPDESHECIDEELLDDIVRSAEGSPNHEDSTLTTVQRFHAFLSENIKRIEEDLLPRVSSVADCMLDEEPPCLRCIVNLAKTVRRLESLRDNLSVFLSVAARTMNTTPEE